ILFFVWPVATKASANQNDSIIERGLLLRFPVPEVFDRDLIVAIGCALLQNINARARSNQSLQRKLVNRLTLLKKMNRRIDVCSTVLSTQKPIGRIKIPPLGYPRRFTDELKTVFRWPVDRALVERVCQIQQLLAILSHGDSRR